MAQSLTRIHLQVFLILLLCFSAIGYAGYLVLHDMQWSSYRERVLLTSQETTTRINRLLTQQRQALEKTARLPAVVIALQRGSSVARSHKENEIESQLPGVVSVHLLSRNDSGVLSSGEALDPACLDYVRRMAKLDTPGFPEFHATGTPDAHYDLAAPVIDENRNLKGYLLARFSSAPLQAILGQSLPPHAYMELQQSVSGSEAQTVVAAGEPSDTVTVSTELGNSPWTLIYQPFETPSVILSGSRKIYFAIILSAFIIITIVLFRLYRKTLNAVRHDIHSLVRMFRDLREGSVRAAYPMALRDFSEIFDYLRDRGQKLVREKEKLKDMGLMDHLSQLGNRRHFETRLQELFDASKSSGPSSVLMIDMDHFKAVNDKHGHDAGDALIVGFANALRKVVRQTDVLARLGGDEFCIIYSYAPLEKATVLAERLRKQLPREIPLTKGVVHQLRWTGGLSAMSDKDTKPDDVLWRADQALLQAKEAGRNVTKVCDPASGVTAKKPIIVG